MSQNLQATIRLASNQTSIEPTTSFTIDDTTHYEEATEAPVAIIMPTKFDAPTGDTDHELTKELSRGVHLGTYQFQATTSEMLFTDNTAQTFTVFDIPILVELLNAPLIRQRLVYLKYFRYKEIEVKLKWNANPTVDGKFLLAWSMFPSLDWRQEGVTCISAYPGATVVDINRSTSAEITIPWAFPFESLDILDLTFPDSLLVDSAAKNLRLSLMNLQSPFFSGAQYLDFTIYAAFKDPHPFGPTPFTQKLPPFANYQGNDAAAQAKTGVVSGILSSTSNVAKSLTAIPGIGEIAAGVGDIASLAGGIFSLFGLSKPHDLATVQRIVQQPIPGMGVTHGNDTSYYLGNQAHTVENLDAMGVIENSDPMSVAYVGEREAIISAFSFRDTNVPGDVLFKMPLSIVPQPTSTANDNYTFSRPFTPGEFIASMFVLARCSTFNLHLDFTKTPLHNGVVEIGFLYSDDVVDDSIISDPSTQQTCYQTVVDLAEKSTVDLAIPFMARTVLLDPMRIFGTFYVKCITRNASNETVNPAIRCLVSKSFTDLFVSKLSIPHYGSNAMATSYNGVVPPVRILALDDLGNRGDNENTRYTITPGDDGISLRTDKDYLFTSIANIQTYINPKFEAPDATVIIPADFNGTIEVGGVTHKLHFSTIAVFGGNIGFQYDGPLIGSGSGDLIFSTDSYSFFSDALKPISAKFQIKLVNEDTGVNVQLGSPHAMTLNDLQRTTGDGTPNLRTVCRISTPNLRRRIVNGAVDTDSSISINALIPFGAGVEYPHDLVQSVYQIMGLMYYFYRGGFRLKLTSAERFTFATFSGGPQELGTYSLNDQLLKAVNEIELPQSNHETFRFCFDNPRLEAERTSSVYIDASEGTPYISMNDEGTFFGLHGVPRVTIVRRRVISDSDYFALWKPPTTTGS